MRNVLLGCSAAVLLLSAVPASAQGSYCAKYGGRDGVENCGFYSLEQCRATLFGMGGFCDRNPQYGYWQPAEKTPVAKRKPRKREH